MTIQKLFIYLTWGLQAVSLSVFKVHVSVALGCRCPHRGVKSQGTPDSNMKYVKYEPNLRGM